MCSNCTYHSKTTEERFWPKVDKDGPIPDHAPELGPCWLWTAHCDNKDYGRFRLGLTMLRAHRVSYSFVHGPIPDGLQVDHLCRVHNCVRPTHLEAVTPLVNTMRGVSVSSRNAEATHCPHGHEYTPENTYHSPGRKQRKCRTCQRLRWSQRERTA